MQRGMIPLTKDEIVYADQLARSSDRNVQNLVVRLGAAVQEAQSLTDANQQLEVEISEDEAEVLLDSLPMPDPANEHPVIRNLRGKLSQFLAKFRFEEPQPGV
jgi:hypothetical protein